MMPNKRLLGLVPEAMRPILLKVLFSWLSLAAGIVLWFEVGRQLQTVKDGGGLVLSALLNALACILLRFALTRAISSAAHKAAACVKTKVRGDIYAKLRRLGPAYNEQFPTVEVVQLAGEGVEQLESYFGNYIHDFILTLPHGYDTKVGELGDTLSGGERQRIGLARAFLHEAPLLLLDEPTSNLDSLNEGMILKALREEAKKAGRSVVLVSHRKSTLGIADRAYAIESGRLS